MRSIIITGASSGIGRAAAQVFLKAGWKVGLLARRGVELEKMSVGYAGAVPLVCDVTDPDAVDSAFTLFLEHAGRLDVLFNNAGMFGPSAPIDEVTLSDWTEVLNLNLTGMFLCARTAFAAMRAQTPQGGRIINNGSISAHAPRPGSVCYTTTKHAITGLTKSLSLDGRPFDIGCGQIDIGNAKTDLLETLAARNAAAGLPPQPMMDVRHAAEAVLHMADLPPEANVQFMTVMATKMPYIGRG